MLKKITPSILIFIILVNIFAPFSVGIDKKNNPTINKSVVEATGFSLNGEAFRTENIITVNLEVEWSLISGYKKTRHVLLRATNTTTGQELYPATDMTLRDKKDVDPNFTEPDKDTLTQVTSLAITGFNANTEYTISMRAFQSSKSWSTLFIGSAGGTLAAMLTSSYDADTSVLDKEISVTTLPTGSGNSSNSNSSAGNFSGASLDSIMPSCGISNGSFSKAIGTDGSITGCAAQLIYYILFVPTSFIFGLTGQFFDYTFSYSVSDKAYRSGFVVEGWGIIRDFCNIFFIFVLLYVAFSTILSIQGFKTKEMIINVVIIGLLINFSLFAAQVLIDTSNILARVFYNGNTIIQKGGANGVTNATPGLKLGPNGEVPLSAALINKVNPQNLIINGSKKINITDTVTGQKSLATKDTGLGVGAFILITLLATAVNVVGIIVFLSVGMIFVARVIGLWLAMIFAPLAFFSYTVPAMQDIEMVGWKKWWPDTLKLAFLAPVFIFFIYLILKFLDTGLDLIHADGQTGIAFVIATVVPFVFIMILLWKAKGVATTMSGKIGEMMAKAGSAVGGLALGAATGGAAMAMRGTIGAAGSAISNSKWAQGMASNKNKTLSFLGNKVMDTGQFIGKKSFDVRNTKAGAAAAGGMGINMGKAAEGGFEGAKTRQITKDQKRAKELEPGQNSQEKKDLNKAQEILKDLENKHNRDIEPQEAAVTTAQQDWSNANSALLTDKNDPAKIAAEATARIKLDQEKATLSSIKNGGLDTSTGQYRTTNGNISQTMITTAATDLGKANTELAGATTNQTNTFNALNTALNNMNTALGEVAQTTTELQTAKTAAATAAATALANPTDIAAAINHTNALAIEASAQAKMDKVDLDVKNTTNAYQNAITANNDANNKLTAAQNKYGIAFIANSTALNAQTAAMASGGLGKSINEIKKGSLHDAQKAYDDKANTNKINYANNTKSTSSKVFNVVTNLGTYSPAGADEAAHNIRMDVKT